MNNGITRVFTQDQILSVCPGKSSTEQGFFYFKFHIRNQTNSSNIHNYIIRDILYFTFNFLFHPVAAFVHDERDKKKRLSEKTICMTSRHGDKNDLQHYNVHSLYGWSQTQPTLE